MELLEREKEVIRIWFRENFISTFAEKVALNYADDLIKFMERHL